MSDIKNNKIPTPAADYLGSMKAADLNIFICDKYGISGDSITRYVVLVRDLFNKNLALSALVARIKEVFLFDEIKARNLALDIAGIRLLVANDWIGNVDGYITSLGGDPAKYAKYVAEQITAVKKEKEDWAAELKQDSDKQAALLREKIPAAAVEEAVYVEPDFNKERNDSLNIFSSQLNDFLSISSSYLLEEYNNILIDMISDEKGFAFRDQLVKAMLENKEKISSAPFLLTKKQAEGTIANWLKYFIEEKGSGLFNNIVLTDFLVKSANARTLKEEEKNKVKKLLLIYRNLKFFPESMPNQTGEDWEIIPSQEEDSSEKARTVKAPALDAIPLKSSKMIAKERAVEDEKKKKIDELNKMLANYPSGSLARKALAEEIKKLETTLK